MPKRTNAVSSYEAIPSTDASARTGGVVNVEVKEAPLRSTDGPDSPDIIGAIAATFADDDGKASIEYTDADFMDARRAEEDADSPDDGEGEIETDSEDAGSESTYKVKVNGEEIEVTFDELTKGYSRTLDYTRKTQALAEQRRTVEAQQTAAIQAAEVFAQYAEAIAMSGQLAPEIEMAYRQAREWQATQDYNARAEMLASERELLHDAMGWKDEAEARAAKTDLLSYVTSNFGYTPEELAQVSDHRIMLILDKAKKYDELTARAGDVRAKGARVLKPGAAKPHVPAGLRARKTARARLAETGNVHDAAAAIVGLLD